MVTKQISDPRELFVHELGDMLWAEKTLEKALPKLAEEATHQELRSAFEHHHEETRTHVEKLEQVFEQLGQPAKARPCPGIEGIKTEHDEFMKKENPSPEICDLFLTGAAARAEHYEIAAYGALVTMAKALGEQHAASLLEQNLRQEEAALRKVEQISSKLAQAV
jgi:ferritin-like metal-binding protein YciE